jgi:ABC-type transport system substrate-binding protein
MTRTRVLAALLAGLTLAGIGTAASALGSDDPTPAAAPVTVVAQTSTTTPTSTPTSTSTSTPADFNAAVTADEAGSRAVARVGGGTVTKVEREVEHGRTVWKVDVRRDTRLTEVHVDVANGAVTRVDDDDDRRDDHRRHGSDDGPGHDRFDDKGGDR